MFVLTNKELRHLKAVFGIGYRASVYDAPEGPAYSCKCSGCVAMRNAKKYFDSLKPNA